MRVRIRFFAGVREQVGVSERQVDLPNGATAAEAAAAIPELNDALGGLAYAVNREYVPGEHTLVDGDEVALIPPVSGGTFQLTEEAIDLDSLVAAVADERAGAIVTFTGTTRVESRGRTVLYLDYEAYPGMAESELESIGATLRGTYNLCGVAITHRIGRVDIGETSVAIAVSAPHRADAFAACREAIDTLKKTVPLWKKEVYEGGEEWIGRGS